MRKLNRLTMTLALLIMAVGGAWAQSSLNVVEFEVPANWETDDSPVTAGDLTGFKTSTLDEAKAWTGAPAKGMAVLVYAFDGGKVYYVIFSNGVTSGASANFRKSDFFIQKSQWKYYYTTEPTEWSLTPDQTGKTWTLAKMPASNIELQVEYEPTKVTMAANDKAMGTVEVASGSKVEWTADTWKGWTQNTKTYTVDDITMTSSESARIQEYISEDKYNNSLGFFVRKMVDDATVTFSTTGDPFSRIEFTMIDDYSDDWNPSIIPDDNWTFEGKSAVWEGEATKSLTLQSCTTFVSKITFFKGAAIPDGVTVNGDGTFTVAKTATVTLKATPAEGYKFLYWEDDQTNTNPVREVTIESGMADKTYKAVFAEITYNVTFVEGTNLDEWTATPNTDVKKDTKVDVKYNGTKKVLGVKAEKKAAPKALAEATAEDLGKIAGADGKIYANVAAAKAASTTACAIIVYVGSETGEASPYNHGLAIAMKDASAAGLVWKTSKGSNDNPNHYVEPAPAIAAKESGSALSSGRNNSTWPAFEAALANSIDVSDGISAAAPASGTSGWFLPSLYQWNKIVQGLSGKTADLSYDENNDLTVSSLNTKIEAAGGTGLQSDRYWSSTEYDSNSAMGFGASFGGAWYYFKDTNRYVRSAFAF